VLTVSASLLPLRPTQTDAARTTCCRRATGSRLPDSPNPSRARARNLSWALVGGREKLEAVRERLGGAAESPTIREADVTMHSVRDVAEFGAGAITTVGPYLAYGEPIVAACAAAGPNTPTETTKANFDLTVEPSSSIAVPRPSRDAQAIGRPHRFTCGFDSIPTISCPFTVEQLPAGRPAPVWATSPPCGPPPPPPGSSGDVRLQRRAMSRCARQLQRISIAGPPILTCRRDGGYARFPPGRGTT